MKKPSLLILLAAMVATSGFATAQTSHGTTNPGKAGTPVPVQAQGGTTVLEPSAATGPNTRAGVKSEIDTRSGAKVGAPAQGGGTPSGAAATAGAGGMSANTRADVKAGIDNSSKVGAPAQGGSTTSGTDMNTSGSTSAERKAARADRKATNKAKRDAAAGKQTSGRGADTGPSSPSRTAPQ